MPVKFGGAGGTGTGPQGPPGPTGPQGPPGTGATPPPAWAATTAYAVDDVRTIGGASYRCITPHTSNAAGPQIDRAKWAPVDAPNVTGSSSVPIRMQSGVADATAPRVGVFQGRPRSFVEKGKRVLWAPTTTTGVNVSSGSVAAGTAPGGSVVLTGTSGSAVMGVALPAPLDIRGKHLVLLLKMGTVASRSINVHLTSAANGTDYTNYIDMNMVTGNVDGPVVDRWHKTSMSPAIGATVGTGADLSAITGVRLASRNGTNVVELGGLWARNDSADRAKVVLWLDDGGYANSAHQNALRVAARYGFPVTTAYIASNLFTGNGPQVADLRWHQDHHGLQAAVHATGPQDHNTTQTGQVAFEQVLEYQAQARAVGLRGTDDAAYWNPGFNGPNTDDDAVTVRKLFRSVRGGRSRLPETQPPADPYATRALMLNTTQVLGDFTPLIEQAILHKGLVQFVWHDISAANLSAQFEALCGWLDTNRSRVDVVTAAGAFDPLCSGAYTDTF